MENAREKKSKIPGKWLRKKPKLDNEVQQSIQHVEETLKDSIEPAVIRGFDEFQRKQIEEYFERSQEYKVKIYRETDDVIMKVYPVSAIKRLTEQKTQEVLMRGVPEVLPPMGSFQRFIIHDYLKDWEGVRTESFGEGKDRHIEIQPLFGRNRKKAKRKLTR